MKILLSILLILPGAISTSYAQINLSPYQGIFGENVLIFDEQMESSGVQAVLNEISRQQAGQEFTDQRFALIFKPGTYDVEVTVDYYVQALGLGLTPDQTVIHGAVQSTYSGRNTNVTTQFWRGAENFKVFPETGEKWMYWAVSQAAPMRRMHVSGDINFDKGGWASGGVLANSIITGRAGLTSGQQWFTRNSEIGQWEGGNWNRVFVGVKGAPDENWPETPVTVIESAPVIRDKPFLTYDHDSGYAVFVPEVQHHTSGVSWNEGNEPGKLIPLDDFYIASDKKDDAASINYALRSGKHLILTPGIYELGEELRVSHPNTVVLGLGLPTLIPTRGNSALKIQDSEGIIIAGVMVDAGLQESGVLIEVGKNKNDIDRSDNPISLHDLYCRIGGALAGTAKTCLEINANNVIGDHFWLWRADHGTGADWEINKSDHGLIVNGDNVTIYGLFNEHFQHYQTYWTGEAGRTYFYQSEIPYEPPSNEVWNDSGKPGFASYKVADQVNTHSAWGLGIYSFFRGEETERNNVRLENAMEVPEKDGIHVTHIAIFAGRLGGINHILNGLGPSTNTGELNLFDGWNMD
ncbi:adenylyl cyclase [Balneola sp. MJW-20]|uniref:adenylyl cyclase n=1 Tax=Gracilimonas aurantiaca TaxID=3234185 RepID=UPI003467EA0F